MAVKQMPGVWSLSLQGLTDALLLQSSAGPHLHFWKSLTIGFPLEKGFWKICPYLT